VESRALLDAAVLTRCRHRVALENDPARTVSRPGGPTDPGVLQRQAEAAAHRVAVAVLLRAGAAERGTSWVEMPTGLPTGERERRTVAALRSGAERVWGAVLPRDLGAGRKGSVELLVRRGSGWVPVLVVNHRVTDPGSGARTTGLHDWAPVVDAARTARSHPRDQLRLAHLTRLLEHAGHAGAEQVGGVVGLDADCVLVHDLAAPSWPPTPADLRGRSTLDEHDARFADRRAVADGVLPTVARRVGECRTCPWWPRCSVELTEAHDVSLVVRGGQVDALRALGVTTVDALAAWDGDAPPTWRGASFADAVVLARAWLVDAPLVRRGPVRIHRADVEVDVDMESYLEHGAYLWGTLLTEGGRVADYRPFATWEPLPTEDEGRSFAEFWTWLSGVRADAAARGRTFAAYCYSEAAENRWLLASAVRFAGRPGIPDVEEVRAFIRSEQWVDVYQAVGASFLCPRGKGLKKVAPVAGFRWRDAEAGGEASMGWYRRAVGLDGEPDAVQRQRLLDYNADDVGATKVLREWMSSPAVLDLPLATEL
jgi:predicted RecB family nuclease